MIPRMKLLVLSLACTALGAAATGTLPLAGIVWGG
jgi:hypothetical protein